MSKVLFETRGQIAYVTLNRPERLNACDFETYEALARAWERFRDDASLRVAILTGSGERAFCVGSDIKANYGEGRATREPPNRLFPVLTTMTKPIVVAINGHCNGGGLEQALACDIRVAAEHARFGLPEVCRGILPGAGGTQRLPRALPVGVALEMILTGAPIDAGSALRWGLVSHVVPRAALLDCAFRLAALIAANGPLAVRAARDAVYQGLALPMDAALRLEQFLAEPLRQSDDAAEGVRAFIEKRRPDFVGH